MLFNRNTVSSYIPNVNAVYYLRGIADDSSLYPIYYIGRAQSGNLRNHLLRQFISQNHPEVVYINYIEFDTEQQAKTFEKQEISRHKPKYNMQQNFMQTYSRSYSNTHHINF